MKRVFEDSGLAGKGVLVTGGSRGIGRAIVEAFAAEGARVTFFYRTADDAAREVAAAAGAVAERVDVRDAEACERAVRAIVERGEPIEVLVNNAGITRDNVLGLLGESEVADVLATNVAGVFNVTRAVLPQMISRRSGAIVNVGSVAAEKGGRGQTAYAASKGAVEALTRSLAVEVAKRGIRVNAVAPGIIETEMSSGIRERAAGETEKRVLLGRAGTAAEVAAAVVFLASRHAAYVTGQVVHVDGGFKME